MIKDSDKFESEVLDLKKTKFLSSEEAYDNVATVFYNIVLHDTDTVVGDIDLRLTMNRYMYYYGNIGYNIKKAYRGNHYALKACEMIKIIARDVYNLSELVVTCNPDNIASLKTIEELGCKYIETVKVPISHELYWKGEKVKAIYKVSI